LLTSCHESTLTKGWHWEPKRFPYIKVPTLSISRCPMNYLLNLCWFSQHSKSLLYIMQLYVAVCFQEIYCDNLLNKEQIARERKTSFRICERNVVCLIHLIGLPSSTRNYMDCLYFTMHDDKFSKNLLHDFWSIWKHIRLLQILESKYMIILWLFCVHFDNNLSSTTQIWSVNMK
jgi:hypothetical protein